MDKKNFTDRVLIKNTYIGIFYIGYWSCGDLNLPKRAVSNCTDDAGLHTASVAIALSLDQMRVPIR